MSDIVIEKNKLSFKIYNISFLLLSVYVLVEMALEIVLRIPEEVLIVLNFIDFIICIIFLIDWLLQLFLSKNKVKYIKTHLVDLVASIPFAQILRPFRIFRIIKLVRILRLTKGVKGLGVISRIFFNNFQRSAITLYTSFTVVIFLYCSLGLYNFERDVNSSINNFGDVIWMSFTTLTSVGYGDIYPVSTGGRVFAGLLVVTGMGFFGLMTAEIASLILHHFKNENKKD